MQALRPTKRSIRSAGTAPPRRMTGCAASPSLTPPTRPLVVGARALAPPRQGDLELGTLQSADVDRRLLHREPRARREVAADRCRQLGMPREDGLRRRTALQVEARQPRRNIDDAVAATGSQTPSGVRPSTVTTCDFRWRPR
jgi:hypothetical protein